jgi:hypothetical protein
LRHEPIHDQRAHRVRARLAHRLRRRRFLDLGLLGPQARDRHRHRQSTAQLRFIGLLPSLCRLLELFNRPDGVLHDQEATVACRPNVTM